MACEIRSLRKAAIVLKGLEKGLAAQLLAQMPPGLVADVTAELARLGDVDPSEQERAVEELASEVREGPCNARNRIAPEAQGSQHPPRTASGDVRASKPGVMEEPGAGDRPAGAEEGEDAFGFLRELPPESVCAAIEAEHARVVALVLSRLAAAQAARVLEAMPGWRQQEVVAHLAVLQPVAPELLREVVGRVRVRLSGGLRTGERGYDGLGKAAQVLRFTDRGTAGKILAGLQRQAPELAGRLRDRSMDLGDLERLEEGTLRRVVLEMDTADLALALRAASNRLRKRCMKVLPAELRSHVKQEMKATRLVRVGDIEAAQEAMLALAVQGEGSAAELSG